MPEVTNTDIPTETYTETSVGTDASFDGLFDGLPIDNLGGIGVIIAFIIGFVFLRKYTNTTKTINKQQKADVKVYNEQKKEDLKVVKEIDNNINVVLEDLQEYSNKEVKIKDDINNIIKETTNKINETKIDPEKRTVSHANDRLRNHLNRIKDKGN